MHRLLCIAGMGCTNSNIIQTVFLDSNLAKVQGYSRQLSKIERNQLQLKYAVVSERLGKLGYILKYYVAITILTKNF